MNLPQTLSPSINSQVVIADELKNEFAGSGFALCSELLASDYSPGKTYALVSPPHLKNGYVQMLASLKPSDVITMPPLVTSENLVSVLSEIEKYRRITGSISKAALIKEPSKALLDASKASALKLDPAILGNWGSMMERISNSISSPIEYTSHTFLGNISGIVSGTFAASPWDRFIEPLNVFAVIVGNPSDGKSVAHREMSKPINRHAARLFLENKNENELNAATSGNKKAEPIPARRLITSDPTIESIFNILDGENGRAISLNNGEFSAILARIGAYSNSGSGKDFGIGFYLTAFDADPASRDRVKFVQHIPRFAFSIVSTCQPGVLKSVFASDSIYNSSGFLHRLDFVYPDSPPVQRLPETGDHFDEDLNRMIDRMIEWRMRPDDQKVLKFNDAAKNCFADWRYDLITKERARGGEIDPMVGKLPGRICRYAGLFAVADAAFVSDRPPTEINLDQVQRAIAYVKFLRSHRRRTALAARGAGQTSEILAIELARFVVENRITSIDTFELRKAGVVAGIHSEQHLRQALGELSRANWLAPNTVIPSRKDEALPRIVELNKSLEKFYK